MADAYIIEVGDIATGIVARDSGGYRFYSASSTYDSLDGRIFGSPRKAQKAAAELVERRKPGGHSRPAFEQRPPLPSFVI